MKPANGDGRNKAKRDRPLVPILPDSPMSPSKLPFKVAPRQESKEVGNEIVGIIEIPTYGGLLRGEQAVLEELEQNLPNAYGEVANLARRIQQEQNVDLSTAYQVGMSDGAVSRKVQELRVAYADQLFKIRDLSSQSDRLRKTATVNAILRYRVDPSWTEQDTNELSAGLFEAIYQFAQEEQGIKPKQEDPQDLSDEAIAQKLKNSSNGSDPSPPTGQESSGDSSEPSPETAGSMPTTSIANPVG